MEVYYHLAKIFEKPPREDHFLDRVLRSFLGELERWIDNTTELLNPNWWNLEELSKGFGGYLGRPRFRKPRIDLDILITSKDNLAVEWSPTGWGHSAPVDFTHFGGWSDGFRSPANRLVFIRDVGALRRIRDWDAAEPYGCLLKAIRVLLRTVKSFLDQHFEVTLATDFYLIEDSGDRLLGYEICRVDHWRAHQENCRRQKQDESEFAKLGISKLEFVNLLNTEFGSTRAQLLRTLHGRGVQIREAKLKSLQERLEPLRLFWNQKPSHTAPKMEEAEVSASKQRDRDLSAILAGGGTITSADLWTWKIGDTRWEGDDCMGRISALFEVGLLACAERNAEGDALYFVPSEVRSRLEAGVPTS